jgi:uncharacterized protein YceK
MRTESMLSLIMIMMMVVMMTMMITGCSSMLALFAENGPYQVLNRAGTSLGLNPMTMTRS